MLGYIKGGSAQWGRLGPASEPKRGEAGRKVAAGRGAWESSTIVMSWNYIAQD